MARITVEDCVLKIQNRFELVIAAAQRARDVSTGSPLTLDRDNDKNPVVALREIADETVVPAELEESVIQGLQRHVEQEEPEDEDLDVVAFGAGLGLPGQDREPAGDETLIEQEIAEDVLTVGEEAVEAGAEITDVFEEAGEEGEESQEDSGEEAEEKE